MGRCDVRGDAPGSGNGRVKGPSAPAGSSPGLITAYRDLVSWVQALTRLPQPRKVYTVATLPAASDYAGATVPVSDGTGSQPTVTAIGSNWVYPDGTNA
jgi:hypothetical protein